MGSAPEADDEPLAILDQVWGGPVVFGHAATGGAVAAARLVLGGWVTILVPGCLRTPVGPR
jgi:hypothetical protein